MNTRHGHVWELMNQSLPSEFGAQPANELAEVVRRAPVRLADGFDALSGSEQQALRAELSNLVIDFSEATRIPGAALRDESAAGGEGDIEKQELLSRTEVVRVASYLALGSLLLRRALTITRDPATGDAVASAAREVQLNERVATQLYRFAAAKGLVPAE